MGGLEGVLINQMTLEDVSMSSQDKALLPDPQTQPQVRLQRSALLDNVVKFPSNYFAPVKLL